MHQNLHERPDQQNKINPADPTTSSLQKPKTTTKLQRNHAPTQQPNQARNGISTYLALTFNTLLSSQRTDTSIVLTTETQPLRLSSGRYPSVTPTLPDLFRSDSRPERDAHSALRLFGCHYGNRFSSDSQKRVRQTLGFEFRHTKPAPAGGES